MLAREILPTAGFSDQVTPGFDFPVTYAGDACVCEEVRLMPAGVNETLGAA
jgi:hypothetical protein